MFISNENISKKGICKKNFKFNFQNLRLLIGTWVRNFLFFKLLLNKTLARITQDIFAHNTCWGRNIFVWSIRPKLGLNLSTKGIVAHSD